MSPDKPKISSFWKSVRYGSYERACLFMLVPVFTSDFY